MSCMDDNLLLGMSDRDSGSGSGSDSGSGSGSGCGSAVVLRVAAKRSPVAPPTAFGDISDTSAAASMSCMDDNLLLGMSERAISPELGSVGSALSKSALYSLLSSNSCVFDAVLTSCATTDGGLSSGFFSAESITF